MNVKEIMESVLDFAQKLPERSADLEKERRLPVDLSKEIASRGFYRMLVPLEYGGFELSPQSYINVLKKLATGDASAAWNVMIGSTTGLLSASLPEKFACRIYKDNPEVMTVGVTAPMGRAKRVDGGYQISGIWPFASGCQNADWICGGSYIFDGEEPLLNNRGIPDIHLMIFESSQVSIKDTWNVSGLKGTGSHHFEVVDEFVPEGRSVILGGKARIDKPLYRFPMLGLLALGIGGVALGTGYQAIAAFKEMASSKKPSGSTRSLAQRSAVQSDLARSEADLYSAESFVNETVGQAWKMAENGESLNSETKARLRLAALTATHNSVAAVDRMYQAGGGASIYDSNVLQRCFRDIHSMTQHIMVANPVYEVVGRVSLGIDESNML